MRCPDCNKFVSYDEPEPEIVDGIDIDEDGRVTGSVRVFLNCADCGTELKESTIDVDHESALHKDDDDDEIDHETEIETEIEFASRGEGKGRYMKMFYGFTIHYKAKCSCGANTDGEIQGFVQASEMEELV